MGIFSKLFGSNSDKGNKLIKNEIADFLKIDLKSLPDETFTEISNEQNVSGTEVRTYQKKLDYRECGIFDFVEVRVIGGNSTNVSLRNYNPNKIDIGKMKTLINEIVDMYGADDNKKGKFNSKDISEYNDAEFNMLFGRRWNDFPKYKNPIAVQRDDDNVEIAIWSANNK